MKHQAEFLRCLTELDVIGVCALWFHVHPELPQPRDNEEALTTIHLARTQTAAVPDGMRCYSHKWLTERNLPSHLPDELKPKADRLYPRRVEAVGIAVKALSSAGEARARAVEKAMSDAVAECYEDGNTSPEVLRERMAAARRKAEA